MAPRTHELIALRTNRNIQGKQKVFCLNSGRVLKRINIIPVIALDRIINIVSMKEQYGNGIDIRNRNKELFDWKNGELEE